MKMALFFIFDHFNKQKDGHVDMDALGDTIFSAHQESHKRLKIIAMHKASY